MDEKIRAGRKKRKGGTVKTVFPRVGHFGERCGRAGGLDGRGVGGHTCRQGALPEYDGQTVVPQTPEAVGETT